MSSIKVLLIEDDERLAQLTARYLESHGVLVTISATGPDGQVEALRRQYDCIVLDVMLPGRDGLSIVRQLRERGARTPVLLLTARGEISEKVEGLNAGADDYLSKPFALEELVARVRALGRRGHDTKVLTLRVADLSLNTISREVRRGEKAIDLAPREYLLLEFLMRSTGRICDRMAIVEKVWDYDFDPGTNLVDVYIMRLREKIDSGFDIKLLHTVRGVGYVLKTLP